MGAIFQIDEERRNNWLKKRVGKITSSELDCFAGSGKTSLFSAPAITYLYKVKRGRRTGAMAEEKTNYNFSWGHANETLCINWLKQNSLFDIVDCNADFDEIIFVQPFDGFGDSPDYYVLDGEGNIEEVGEIKAPVDFGKLEQAWEISDIRVSEYYYQCLGHLIAHPTAKRVCLTIWDGYVDYNSPNICKTIKLERSECTETLKQLTSKIQLASKLVDKCLNEKLCLITILSTYK